MTHHTVSFSHSSHQHLLCLRRNKPEPLPPRFQPLNTVSSGSEISMSWGGYGPRRSMASEHGGFRADPRAPVTLEGPGQAVPCPSFEGTATSKVRLDHPTRCFHPHENMENHTRTWCQAFGPLDLTGHRNRVAKFFRTRAAKNHQPCSPFQQPSSATDVAANPILIEVKAK